MFLTQKVLTPDTKLSNQVSTPTRRSRNIRDSPSPSSRPSTRHHNDSPSIQFDHRASKVHDSAWTSKRFGNLSHFVLLLQGGGSFLWILFYTVSGILVSCMSGVLEGTLVRVEIRVLTIRVLCCDLMTG